MADEFTDEFCILMFSPTSKRKMLSFVLKQLNNCLKVLKQFDLLFYS